MQVELNCANCFLHFSAAADTPAAEIVDRMIDNGPWFGLADGQTFEDMIEAVLRSRGRIRCPECGAAVSIAEETPAELLACGS